MTETTLYDVIILGSGPAGYTAALYASRAFLKTLMLTGPQTGGQLTTTTEVDNYPGFPDGIQGPQLVEDMKKQVERFGTEVVQQEAVSCQLLASLKLRRSGSAVSKNERTFTIKTSAAEYTAKTVIITTGAAAQYLGLPSETKLMGKGVSACATCDGFFFKGKEVIVIGGGDTAMEEATFLTTFATKVTIIHRREEFRASPIMLDRAKKNSKISFLTNKIIEEVLGDAVVTGVRLKDVITREVSELSAQGFFLAIGHKPNTDFLKGFIEIDPKGYVITKHPMSALSPHTETSVPGVFAAGDCVDPHYRQAIVAAGQGCMAALDSQAYLTEQK